MTDKSANVRFAESLHEKQLKFKPDQVEVAADERKTPLDRTTPRQVGVMDGK